MLETVGGAPDAATLARWEQRIVRLRRELGWPDGPIVARVHASGASLAFAAPVDQLFSATEVNEWAWLASLGERGGKEAEGSSELSFAVLEGSGALPSSALRAPSAAGGGFDPGGRREGEASSETVARDDALLPFSLREKVARERRMRETRLTTSAAPRKPPFDIETLEFIRQLRASSTDPERLLWGFLRNRRVLGQKFRRQSGIGPYVLDFHCHDLGLAIELDGGQHNDEPQIALDQRRDEFLQAQGIHTLRYWNHDVMQHLDDVLADIWHEVEVRVAERGAGSVLGALPSSALRAPSPGGRREDGLRAPSAAGGGFDPDESREAEASSEYSTRDDALLPFSLREKVARERRMRETRLTMSEAWSDIALFHAPGHAAAWDEDSALHTLHAHARGERNDALRALVAAGVQRDLTVLIDDDTLSIGCGSGARCWPIADLPAHDSVDWHALHDIPIALVTGSNGKTTTVRLLAAFARAHGWRAAHSCTDGLFVDGVSLAAGDYSGPAGARALLRHRDAEVAILETARGGILRRGIAPQRARCAIVTNISDDHFGEYGIHTLDDLAAVKFAVARCVPADGLLVLNADDPRLAAADTHDSAHGWFALDADHAILVAHRERGGATCGVSNGRLLLGVDRATYDLGAVVAMPLTLEARATYNIANIAAAVLAASALGIAPATIADVLARFGRDHADNPGRLQRWRLGATTVFVDYAHNPEGLRGLLEVATAERGGGRLVLVLGQAGNRGDAEIRELAAAAAAYHPDHVVLKDMQGMLRGRAPGEVPAILRDALVTHGIAASSIVECLDESAAARAAVEAARPGDIVVLPIHGARARAEIAAMLDASGLRP